jgi:RimJ/RimL family protein N-acetyltransferase
MTMPMIPHLETERLLLREMRGEDFEAWASFMADPLVVRYLNGTPQSRADAWRAMAMTLGHWALRGFGMWAVERKSDRAFMGRIGVLSPEGWPGLEVGWTLGRPYWGHGYATEAAAASMRYAFLTQPVDKVISCIDPDNKASQAVAMRLGETKGPRHEIVVGARSYPVDVWSIAREDWQKRA